MSYKLTKQKFMEKELDILRSAIDKAEHKKAKKIIKSDTIKEIIKIVEIFIRDNKLICYGGTAINNILPKHDQFYDKSIEIPDYDFFSPDALNDAKKLADVYYKKGFTEVEAKAGIHHGTFKVFVNFIPVADITQQQTNIFESLTKDAIKINNILYASPNFLRMSAYLELSRPAGDVSRWEKILKRLVLLNKHHPLKAKNCNVERFARDFEKFDENVSNYYDIVKTSAIDQGLIFFGGYAMYYYTKYMAKKDLKYYYSTYRSKTDRKTGIPDFDLLSEDPYKSCQIIKEKLKHLGVQNLDIIKRDKIGDLISTHYEIKVGEETIAFIYEPLACHSYNTIIINGKVIKIATIDTMLSFYLAFIYADRPYYEINRILCMSEYLFKVQAKNRLEQKGVLKRFSINCYGKQNTLENIRASKAEKFQELKKNRTSKEFEEYFLRYIPRQRSLYKKQITCKPKTKTKNKTKSKTKTKTKTKNKTKSKTKTKTKTKQTKQTKTNTKSTKTNTKSTKTKRNT